MRTLLLLTRIILSVAAVFGIVFLLGREALLYWGYLQIQREANRLQSMMGSTKEYAQKCVDVFGQSGDVYAFSGLQLRFQDDQTYHSEIICTYHESDPIELRVGKLPMWVRKMPGSSGLYFGEQEPVQVQVVLGLLGRTIQYRKVTQNAVGNTTNYPATSCTGWGYQCCDLLTQTADGVPAPGQASDCRGSCFSACRNLPVVLSFRTDPDADYESKVVVVDGSSADIIFSVVAGGPGVRIAKIVIDYGDESSDTIENQETISQSHHYQCDKFPSCSYTAVVAVYDADGRRSPSLSTTEVNIELRRSL